LGNTDPFEHRITISEISSGTRPKCARVAIIAERLQKALEISDRAGLARYVALQPHYGLLERRGYEGAPADLRLREGLACVPYWALARGFLTGKYRAGREVDSPRAGQVAHYLEDARAMAVLEALDRIAGAHGTTVAAVALAWVRAQPAVAAPIASARNAEQLAELIPGASLELTVDELAELTEISAPARAR
jgi:aryl-alcohol dehydrogenase-like predicted oxidoreductase